MHQFFFLMLAIFCQIVTILAAFFLFVHFVALVVAISTVARVVIFIPPPNVDMNRHGCFLHSSRFAIFDKRQL